MLLTYKSDGTRNLVLEIIAILGVAYFLSILQDWMVGT